MSVETRWNERASTLEQERRFRRLIALHTLTDAWLHAIRPESDESFRLERMGRVTLNQNLWLFEKTRLDSLPLRLENLVGAMQIDDFLSELRDTIWIIQAATLGEAALEGAPPEEVLSVFQQASWKHGREYAESIWGETGRMSREGAFQALMECHLYEPGAFLLERKSELEISFIWKKAPSRLTILETSDAVGRLHSVHEHWIKGFLYGVSRQTRVMAGETRLQDLTLPRFTLL